jgi:hypothetical protein
MGKTSRDYELAWPRELFQAEASALLNRRSESDWRRQAEWLLEDAFVGSGPRTDLNEVTPWTSSSGATEPEREFMVALLRKAANGVLREESERPPYYSQRRGSSSPDKLSQAGVTQRFRDLIVELERKGYFERVFDKDCVDDAAEVNPSTVIEDRIGVGGLWPLEVEQLLVDDRVFDLMEVFYDLVARPRSRNFHDYGRCGWHHSKFSTEAGRRIYVWRVNRLLERSDLGLRLSDEGEDAGRLVEVTDDARQELVTNMNERTDDQTGDSVRHAIAQFRKRGATALDKRTAIVTLAGVLEERRDLLKAQLFSKDEGALFTIANEFGIRHQRAGQQRDYNPLFLDWMFWWYLATIDLADRLIAEGLVSSGPGKVEVASAQK